MSAGIALTRGSEQHLKVAFLVLHHRKEWYNWKTVVRLSKSYFMCQVTPDDIRAGVLADDFVCIVIPGGMAPRTCDALGRDGMRAIKTFVEDGGGFLGICAGAYIACAPGDSTSTDDESTSEYDNTPWRWGLIKARVLDLNHWNRGSGNNCELSYTALGRKVMCQGAKRVSGCTTRFANGPLFDIMEDDESYDPLAGPLEVFASFDCEFNKHGTAPPGVMFGSPAIVGGSYGSGRVVAISPHLEKGPIALAPHLRNLVRWIVEDKQPSSSWCRSRR